MHPKIIIAVMCLVALASLVNGTDPAVPELTEPVTADKIKACCEGTINSSCTALKEADSDKGDKCCTQIKLCLPKLIALIPLILVLELKIILKLVLRLLGCIIEIVIVLIANIKIAGGSLGQCNKDCTVIKDKCLADCRSMGGVTGLLIALLEAILVILLGGCGRIYS